MKTNGGYIRKACSCILGFVMACLISVGCGKLPHRISVCDLQGDGETSPYFGQKVEISGIITADYEDQPSEGFFIQDKICSDELDTGISSGVFVLTSGGFNQVTRGDEVSVSGIVVEFFRETILVASEDSIQIISVTNSLPDMINLSTRFLSGVNSTEYEPWEGMQVSLPSAIVIESADKRGSFLVLPDFNRIDSQFLGNNEVKGILRIIQDQTNLRLSSAVVGDYIHNLKGLIRQDHDGYILHLIEPESVILEKPKDSFGIILSEEKVGNNHTPTISPTITITLTGTPTPYPVDLLITELLPNPKGTEPDGEWIEIYNPGARDLPLTGIKIGDEIASGGKEGMFRFPDGSIIGAKEVLVIGNKAATFRSVYGFYPDFEFEDSDNLIPDLIPYLDWSGNSVQFSNGGDEALLLDPWDNIIDQISYGDSDYAAFQKPVAAPKEGNTLERYPPDQDTNQAGDWRERVGGSPGRLDQTLPTPVIISTPSPQPTSTFSPSPSMTFTPAIPSITPAPIWLLINEIMANPAGAEPEGEWIEILNPNDESMPLTGVKVGDAVHPGDPEGMLLFPEGDVIEPGELIIIAYQAVDFESTYDFKPDYEMSASDPAVKLLIPYRSWAGGKIKFNNSGDDLVILDGWDEIVDTLAYGNSDFILFQPCVSAAKEGYSLARYPAGIDTDTAGDWKESEIPSPGEINSGPPTNTPTIAPSASETPTLGLTPSLTLSPSLTCSLTVQVSPTSSPVFTIQETSTDTQMPPTAISHTPSVTDNNTITATIRASLTPLPSLTDSPTLTPHYSATIFPVETPTMTSVSPTPASTPEFIEDLQIVLNEIHADPDPVNGDANGDGEVNYDDDEFLEFINLLDTDLDISDWEITDAARSRFSFPGGTVLSPYCPIIVFGGGTPEGDFGGSLVLTAGSLALNNTGDTISLWDEEGNLRLRLSYGPEGGLNQSLTRNPDLIGYPLEVHSESPSAENRLYSPGLKLNGEIFEICP
ncbi:MAG: lamin tail domain-containing protein [Anaerolineales bacterium]